MYIAMNRFKVRPEEQEAFKARWFDREVYLKTVPGFVAFHLLQGPDRQGSRPLCLPYSLAFAC